MNCPRCYTANEPEARFCRNCGADMAGALAAPATASNKDLMLVLFVLGFDYLFSVIWFILQRIIAPGMYKSGTQTTLYRIYDIVGWTEDILCIIIMLVCAILVKPQTAKILLIVFMLIRIVTFIGYRVFKLRY